MRKFIIVALSLFLLFSCKNEPQKVIKITGKQIPINDSIASASTFENFIKPYRIKVNKEMNAVLCYTPKDLVRTDGKLESSLGNLLADLSYERANPVFNARTGKNIDFAMFNYGGIRASIPKGQITMENAFNLMPFENTFVVAELSPNKIKELIHYLISQNIATPISKQFHLKITKNGYKVTVNGKPLNPSKNYLVLTSDYLQNGGDNMNFFKNPVQLFRLDYKVRNAIIDYFKSTDTVKVKLDGRFTKEN